MIKPESRFVSDGQVYFGTGDDPTDEVHCNIWDWDQLRLVKIKGTAKLFPCELYAEIPIFAQFADLLSPEVRAITVDDEGFLVGVSTDAKEDDTVFVGYLPYSIVDSLADCQTVEHSKLHELDRLAPQVDLVAYDDETGKSKKVIFKYNAWGKKRRLEMAWNELHLVKSLPPHPNLVPFDRVVLEDKESRIIGFTTKFIPGGTIEDNTELPFRFEWLQQLTQLVDYLNLDLGIMHQDIASRNLLVDPETSKILLFDFDWAACGGRNLMGGRDDVMGVAFMLYELITEDIQFSKIPYWDRNIDMVQSIAKWPCKRKLDSPVSTFRTFLNKWVASRTSDTEMQRYLDAPNRPMWPSRPVLPDYSVPFEAGRYFNGEITWRTGARLRRTALELGQYCFQWERPGQSRLLKKEEKGEKDMSC
ncbi:hypothetical protein GQ44DRAFT_653220 [Phaeosphaeriaceae sp. PMI808]|nr:hypothetical protein GQ44DRAFT_653220 [Phaeosphaeriaceae sp. PMI808]